MSKVSKFVIYGMCGCGKTTIRHKVDEGDASVRFVDTDYFVTHDTAFAEQTIRAICDHIADEVRVLVIMTNMPSVAIHLMDIAPLVAWAAWNDSDSGLRAARDTIKARGSDPKFYNFEEWIPRLSKYRDAAASSLIPPQKFDSEEERNRWITLVSNKLQALINIH